MTVPSEEVNSVELTREFLWELSRPRGSWKRWSEVRTRALQLLRHYPWRGRVGKVYEIAGLVSPEGRSE